MALDWGILHWIQNNISCPFLDAVVPKLTMLGNAGIIWILAGVLLLCTKKYRRQGALVLVGLLAGLLVGNVALKHLVARSRPCWLDPSVQLLIATPTDYSFPSGHTLSSTIAATILTKTDRRFGYAAISLAVLIALSRLYLCSATSFLRNWDSILEKKRANLRSISEPARLRQPPPQKHGSGTRKRAGSKHTRGATNSRPSRAFCPLVG